MNDVVLLVLAITHGVVLSTIIILYCRHMNLPWREWPLFLFLFLWSSLITGGQLAGALYALNNLLVYVVCTFIGVAVILALHRLVYAEPCRTPYANPLQLPQFVVIRSQRARKYLWYFLLITLGLALILNIVTALCVYPGNGDSMVYRLPRAFWYVTHGNLLHPFVSTDKRVTFYPLNGILLYIPLVLYALPGIVHTFPSIFAWLAVSYGAYRFARELGADRLLSTFSAWLLCMTPSVLVQATSTNDEIFAAVAMMLGFYFLWRWLVSGYEHYLYSAALGAGISVGTKLHVVFLLPILFVATVWFLCFLYRTHTSWRACLPQARLSTVVICLLAASFMGTIFLALNYISSGHIYFFEDFASQVFNLSASLHGALQNLLIYSAQMMLAPIADLNFWTSALDRELINRYLNSALSQYIAPFIDTDVSHYHLHYRFAGVIIPTSPFLVEFSLWPGFVWLLWPLQFVFLRQQKFTLRPLIVLFAITPLAWLLIWSFTTLYMEGIPVYFSFYFICAAPSVIFCFAATKNALFNKIRWYVIGFVTLTSLIINLNVYLNSTFRGFKEIFNAQTLPMDWLQYEKPAIDELQRANNIQIIAMHSMVYYFSFMHWNVHAKYFAPIANAPVPSNELLQIAPVPSEFKYGFIPIKIPNKVTPGMTHLGNIRGVDREAIFADGNGVDLRWPDYSGYIILGVNVAPRQGTYRISISDVVPGLQLVDRLQFSYVLKSADDSVVYQRTWDDSPMMSVNVPNDPKTYPYILYVTVRSTLNGVQSAEIPYPLEHSGSWLIQDNPNQSELDKIHSAY